MKTLFLEGSRMKHLNRYRPNKPSIINIATLLALLLLNCTLLLANGKLAATASEAFDMRELSVAETSSEVAGDARRLADVLGRIYRKNVPVVPDGKIVITVDSEGFSNPQEYEIITCKDKIIITGATSLACGYAVSDLLHELGYRRFFPSENWEIVPDTPPATINLSKRETPDFVTRSIWPGWGLWPEYRGLNTPHDLWHRQNRTGGFRLNTRHIYGYFISSNKAEFDKHPEYYALVDGERKDRKDAKICIGNPGLRQLFCDFALDQFRRNPMLESISCDPSDGSGWCECPECAKLGSVSDQAVFLANSVAEAVGKEFDGKRVGMYAYNMHSPPPNIKVHPDVIVSIATGFIRHGWTVDRLIDGWRAREAEIGIRDYYFPGNYFFPGPPSLGTGSNPARIADSIKHFHRSGVRYMTAEAADDWAGGLGYYVASRLLWDTSLSLEEILDDFFGKAFPQSKSAMRGFYALISGANPRPLSHDLLGRMYRSLAQAREMAASEPERKRIDELICFTRFCELGYAHQINANTSSYRSLLQFAADIKPMFIVHTYAMYRDERRLGRGLTLAKEIDWQKSTSPDIEKILEDGIAGNQLLNFDVIDFGNDLTLVTLGGRNITENPDPIRGHREFFLYSDGTPVEVKLTGGLIKHYRNRGNIRLELIQIGGPSDTGEIETVVQTDASVPPDGEERTVKLEPRHPGLHRLVINDGNDMSRIVFPDGLPVAYPVDSESVSEFSGNFYFYVPKGTEVLGFYAKTARGRIDLPNRRPFENLTGRDGFYKLDVPDGMDGRVWQIRGMRGVLKLLTVPSTLNLNSNKLLLPRGIDNLQTNQ